MEGLGESIRRAMESGRPSRPSTAPTILTARDIMATKVVCLRPTQTMAEAIALLLKHGISGAPVIDGPSRLIGMLSEADCMRPLVSSRFHSQGSPNERLVEEIMSRSLTTITLEPDIYSIADRFLSDGLRRLPVVNQGELMGQVSRRDVLQAIQTMG